MLRTLLLLAVLVLASGCVASLPVASSTDELATIPLAGETVRVHLLDGATYVVTDVEMGAEQTTLRLLDTATAGALATDSLREVAILVRRERAQMIAESGLTRLGVGLAITGIGLAWTVVDLQSNDSYFPSTGPALVTLVGGLYTIGGTIGGLVRGATAPSERWQTVYRRPPGPPRQPDAVTAR